MRFQQGSRPSVIFLYIETTSLRYRVMNATYKNVTWRSSLILKNRDNGLKNVACGADLGILHGSA
ncbi:protein of unknown function [Acidithiobacillus ferrivorans]|uniref:Uncharacterized protein n=1 Tax=Acidithiobacillus ferrivorans TaxID=160808 RepID=A0A060UQJ2_9PROT|nr:hypothetical protein AFERRI_110008 [Acidithiobacillus ferrivorans]SMH64237.1 protein of unknown function [Acidithiobacillus ferrivorans]